MDPFRLCLALGPVATYLLLLAAINLSRRPFVVSGARDTATLGLAVSGLVIIGPMELFLPVATVLRFGSYVWVLLAVLYALGLVFCLLVLRPRLVVYNISTAKLRPILADVVSRLDDGARWAGDSLLLPNLGVQLHLEYMAALRNVSLLSVGAHQNYAGWRQLELGLRAAVSEFEVGRNLRGVAFIAGAGALLLLFLLQMIAIDPQAVAQAMFDMIRL